MSSNKYIVASGASEQSGTIVRANQSLAHPLSIKPTELLSKREFRERFQIPNRVSVQLLKDGPVPAENSGDNAICFTKEQFNTGLCLPLLSLFKQFLHYTRIPPFFLYPNMIRVLMGCSVLDMLFHLDLSLLEVLFVYSIKKVKNDIFSLSASIPSLQLVTGLPDLIRGVARRHVLVKGPWAGLMVHPQKEFSPIRLLRILGKNNF